MRSCALAAFVALSLGTSYAELPDLNESEAEQGECHVDSGQPAVLVHGTITDPSGAIMQNTPVSLACGAVQQQVTTDGAGQFALKLSPGTYQLGIHVTGFSSLERQVRVNADQDTRLDVQLVKASSTSEIEVHAGSSGYSVPESSLGTHTDTPIMDIPQGVYVVPQAVIRDQQAVRLTDVTRNVSGVTFANDAGSRNESLVIRGFTSSIVFKDGFRNDGGSTRTFNEMSNIDNIEILKGPSSSVFGRLDPSGVVNLVTAAPLPVPQISVQMQGGSNRFLRPTVDMTGPLTRNGKMLYRFIASGQDSASFRDFVMTRRLFLSPTLTWLPTRRTSVRFYSEFLGGSNLIDRGLIAIGTRPVNLPISRFLGDPTIFAPYREGKGGVSVDQVLGRGWTFRSYERSSTGYAVNNARSANSLLADQVTVRMNDIRAEQYFQSHYWINEATGKVRTGRLEHTVLAGFDLNYESIDNSTQRATNTSSLNIYAPNYAAMPPRQLSLRTVQRNANGFGGGYLQDQLRLGRHITFTAGFRYDLAKLKTIDYLNNSSTSSRNNAVNPRLGITYRPITQLAVYATWSKSFLPQSGVDVNGNGFEPERGELKETGFKYELFSRRTTGTVSIFQVDRQNVLTTNPQDTNFQIQVGAQRSRGVEWNQTTRAFGGVNLITGYAFTRAVVSRDEDYVVNSPLVAAPRHTGNLWLQYIPQRSLMRRSSFGAGVFGASKSEGMLREQGNPGNYFLLPGYARVDAGFSYDLRYRGTWGYRFQLNGNNLLDRKYFSGSGGRFAVYPGSTRSIILSLQVIRRKAD